MGCCSQAQELIEVMILLVSYIALSENNYPKILWIER